MKFAVTGIVVLAVLIGAGALWLASARVMPPPQKVEQAIPDGHIPR